MVGKKLGRIPISIAIHEYINAFWILASTQSHAIGCPFIAQWTAGKEGALHTGLRVVAKQKSQLTPTLVRLNRSMKIGRKVRDLDGGQAIDRIA